MEAVGPERYGFRVFRSEEDGGYFAVFPEIPLLSGFGATEAEALDELRLILEAVVEVYRETRPAATQVSAGLSDHSFSEARHREWKRPTEPI